MKEEKISYHEWLAEVKAMDRDLDIREKMKVWHKFAWDKPLHLPPMRRKTPMAHFGGSMDGEPLSTLGR